MANFPINPFPVFGQEQGLYINSFTNSGRNVYSSTSPLENIAGNTNNNWSLLWAYLIDNAYTYIILGDINGKTEISTHIDKQGVLDFIQEAKSETGCLIFGAVDLFYHDFSAISGDYGFIKSYNNDPLYGNNNSSTKFDGIHINTDYWNFPYTKYTSPDTSFNVSTVGAPAGYVRKTTTGIDSSITPHNSFFYFNNTWKQVIGTGTCTYLGNTYQTFKLWTNSLVTYTGTVRVLYDSNHTLPLNIYFDRIDPNDSTALLSTLVSHNQLNNNDLDLEILLTDRIGGSADPNIINLARLCGVWNWQALTGGGEPVFNTKVLLNCFINRPQYAKFTDLLNGIYSGSDEPVTPSASGTYGYVDVTEIPWADFVSTDMQGTGNSTQDFFSTGMVLSSESGTFNSSCNSAGDYISSASTPKACTDRNFSGYWFEGRILGSSELPLDSGNSPVSSLPFLNSCLNQSINNPPFTYPPIPGGYSPKTIENAWNLVTQSGEMQLPPQIGTPLSLNDDSINTDLTDWIQFDTIVIYDQQRIRQLNTGGSLSVNVTGIQEAGCFQECNGHILISPSGGTAPYTYNWTFNGTPGFSTDQNVYALCAGDYSCEITDDDSNTVSTSTISITEFDEIVITYNSTDEFCSQENGSITLSSISPGTYTDYTYDWTNTEGFHSTTHDISNLINGTYTLVVTSIANGCSTSLEVEIDNIGVCYDIHGAIINDCSCPDSNDGNITITIDACVTPPFPLPVTVDWTGPNGYTYSNSGQPITNLAPGVYTAVLTEHDTGCTNTESFTVQAPDPIQITPLIKNPMCEGTAGIFITNISGGTPPYNFQWSTGSTDQNITDIEPGNYTLTITDDNGCIVTRTFNVLTDVQEDIKELQCCLGELIVKYIKLIRIGSTSKANCLLLSIKYLYLIINSITSGCYSKEGSTEDGGNCAEIYELIQIGKQICPCNTCN